jgi:hypothetical protein
MEDSKTMATPMSTTTALTADEEGEHVEQKEYRSMIRSLLYLTAMRPDIQFSVCLCAHFEMSPRTSSRQAVKCIFRYFGLWYSASSSLALHGLSEADFAGCQLDRNSTYGTSSSWDLLWCLVLPANSQVLLNPLLKQSMLPQLVVALSSFGSHTP